MFIGRTDVEAETPILWPPDVKNWLNGKDPDAGKDWRWEEKGMTEYEMVGWHHRLSGHEFEWTPGVGDGQGGLACCSPCGCKESIQLTDWTGLAWNVPLVSLIFLEISYLSHSIVFLCFFALITRKAFLSLPLFFGTLHSDGYIFLFLYCLSLLFFSQLLVRPPQTTILPFCISFSWGWSWSLSPVQCQEPLSIVLQELYHI